MTSNGLSLYHFFRILTISLLLGSIFLCGCATNPATKQIEFMTVSEDREFTIGQGVDKQVREEMGKLAEYNGFEASEKLAAGTLLKIPPTLRIR